MKFFKTAAVIFASLAAFLLSGCENSSSNGNVTFYNSENPYSPQSPAGSVETKPPGNSITASEGTPAVISNLEINLLSSQIYGSVKKDSMHTEDSDYVACRFELKNNGSEETNYSLYDFYINENGTSTNIPVTSFALMEASSLEEYELFEGTISAGESKTGYVVFEIPSSWNNIALAYNPSSGNPNNDSVLFTINKDDIK